MSEVLEALKNVGLDLLEKSGEAFNEAVKNRLDDEFYRGYDRATNVCTKHISHKIKTLRSKIKDGKSLSKEEQFLMVQTTPFLTKQSPQFQNFVSHSGSFYSLNLSCFFVI